MRFTKNIFLLLGLLWLKTEAQTGNPNSAPYCTVSYATGQCNQPGPSNTGGNFINDFINCVQTTGANTNINNCNSGCNGNPGNYVFYCAHYLVVNPGQTISVTLQSGNTYAQGFAIFVDWNQDNTFNLPSELVAATNGFPAAATFTTLSFSIPSNIANGTYRMRIRCSYATSGLNIPPCGQLTYGETEDYNIYVGSIPPNSGVVSVTATANSPVCAGQSVTFAAITSATSGITYTWTGPNNFSSTASSFVLANTTPSINGTYNVVASNGSCPGVASVSVQVVPYPTFSISLSSPTVCQGGSITASVVIQNPGNFSYLFGWAPTLTAGIASPSAQATAISPPTLAPTVSVATTVYSVLVWPSALTCLTSHTTAVTVYNTPVPTLSLPVAMCNTAGAVSLSATPGGGTWSAAGGGVSPGGLFNPGLALNGLNIVNYSISLSTCIAYSSGTIGVAKFNTSALTSTLSLVCEQDAPINLMNIVQNTLTGVWSGGPYISGNAFFTPTGLASGVYTATYNTVSTPTTAALNLSYVCPSSTVLNIQVFNPPVPVIVPINPVCSINPTVALSASPSGGIWSQSSGVSSGGIQTPSLCSIGTNTVVYSAGIGTCAASSSATFVVSKFNTAALSGSVANLCVTSPNVNLLNIAQNTVNGTWYGPNVSNNSGGYLFSPTGLPTGTYVLTYTTTSSPNPTMCPDSRTIAVSVLNPPVPSITSAGPFCSVDAPFQLSVTPANSGTWTSFSYVNSAGILTPSLCAIGNNMVEYVTGTPTCSVHKSFFISIEAFVPATITKQLQNLCDNSQPVSLQPLTTSGTGIWSGNGVQGSYFNPSLTGSGTHVISYSTSSLPSGLCPDQNTLTVKVFSLAVPVISSHPIVCNNSEPFKIEVSPVGGIFMGLNNVGINIEGLFSPANALVGSNIVNYSISSGPCIAFAQTTLTVEGFVPATFAIPPTYTVCQGKEPLNLNTFVNYSPGQWSGPGVNGSMFNPNSISTGSPIKLVYSTASLPTGACKDQADFYITVSETPTVDLVLISPHASGCTPFEVVMEGKPRGNSAGGVTDWYLGDGSQKLNGNTISHIFHLPGVYTVTANYTSGNGCKTQATLDSTILVKQSPVADFEFEPAELSIASPETQLINQSTVLGDNRYEWRVQTMMPSNDVTPLLKFATIGTYSVKLTATSFNGCKAVKIKNITVKNDFNIFFPNSFTPNDDGLNDLFGPVLSPYGLDFSSFEMQIFDRWGHLVYSTRDVNKGWDGTYLNKGINVLEPGTYVFKSSIRDITGSIHSKMGSVILVGH